MKDDFGSENIQEIAKKILKKGSICNNCLGRNFAHISTGLTNRKRGEILRKLLKEKKPKHCIICNDLFKNLEKWKKEALKKLKGIDYSSFLVGTKLSQKILKNEEDLWEDVGIEYCESIRAEINRELGKLIERATKKNVDERTPDINVILNLQKYEIEIKINPIFIFGSYKKLARGIPQTRLEGHKKAISDIIAEPILKTTKGSDYSFHGCGREDIDAKCLDWRPFVLEIFSPKKKPNLKSMKTTINRSKKANVSKLSFTERKKIKEVKKQKPDKTYRLLTVFEKSVENIEKIKEIRGTIRQQTPKRVAHRRADIIRMRKVKNIKYKKINNKTYELIIKAESGLYIKELVTGDNNRTQPNISKLLNNKAEVKELDVMRIWYEGKQRV